MDCPIGLWEIPFLGFLAHIRFLEFPKLSLELLISEISGFEITSKETVDLAGKGVTNIWIWKQAIGFWWILISPFESSVFAFLTAYVHVWSIWTSREWCATIPCNHYIIKLTSCVVIYVIHWNDPQDSGPTSLYVTHAYSLTWCEPESYQKWEGSMHVRSWGQLHPAQNHVRSWGRLDPAQNHVRSWGQLDPVQNHVRS